ncbi:hypothetical protein Leryth_012218 [Lithospermum erythrorhizon]|nr:hypothetical protein Leryth_012218 [Lithospermum erythrorhizon]
MHQPLRQLTSISAPNISDINSKIKEFVLRGIFVQALKLYKAHIHPLVFYDSSTKFILPSVIKACAHEPTHQFVGFQIHCNIIKNGYDSESTVSNSLLSMYAKFADTEKSYKVFDKMPQRDFISWNSMINCYIQNRYLLEALNMFKDMYIYGVLPKKELVASVLSTCMLTGNLRLGRAIHGLVIVDDTMELTVYVSTALVDFYFRSGDSETACIVFSQMEVKNEVSWTAMISGCVALGRFKDALDYFGAMLVENISPNIVTLISVLPVCAEIGSIKHGKEIHGYAFRRGMDSDFRLSSALIHTYSECKEALRTIRLIFTRSKKKDIVMWSSIIKSYSQSKNGSEEAMHLFNRMQIEGIRPNDVTMLAVISACSKLSSINQAQNFHGYVIKSGFRSLIFIQNSLINMYSKCGSLSDAVQIFKEMCLRDSISWSALINAYGLHGYAEVALQLFHEMQESGIKPDGIAFLAALSACNHTGLVDEGKKLFDEAVKEKYSALTIEHYVCYIDLLGRAGKLEDVIDIVRKMPIEPSTKVWSSLVSACKLHERMEIAETLARELIKEEPDNDTNYKLLSMVKAERDNWHGVQKVGRKGKEKRARKKYGLSRIELET